MVVVVLLRELGPQKFQGNLGEGEILFRLARSLKFPFWGGIKQYLGGGFFHFFFEFSPRKLGKKFSPKNLPLGGEKPPTRNLPGNSAGDLFGMLK